MDDRRFLKLLFDCDFGKLVTPEEQPAFSAWLADTVAEHPALLIAFPLGDGSLGYARYQVAEGPINTMSALEGPDIYVSAGDGCAYLPMECANLPCWQLGTGDIVPRRF